MILSILFIHSNHTVYEHMGPQWQAQMVHHPRESANPPKSHHEMPAHTSAAKLRMLVSSAVLERPSATTSFRCAAFAKPLAENVATRNPIHFGVFDLGITSNSVLIWHRYDQATLAILERIEKLESSLGPVISAYDQSQGPQLATRASFRTNVEPGPRAEARVSRKPDQVALDTHRIDDVEGPPSSSILLQASSEMSIEAMLLWPIFEHHLFRLPSQPLIRDLDSVAHRRNSRSDRSKIDRLNLDLPTVHNLVQGFVANILPSNPVLNPSTLRHDVQGALDDGMKPSGRTCLVVSCVAGDIAVFPCSDCVPALSVSLGQHLKFDETVPR